MVGEIALRFKSSGLSTGTLSKIPFDVRATIVAIHHQGPILSINYRDLKPGDIILFDMGKFDPLVVPAIERYQMRVFGDKKVARWKHVGILDDNLQVWDAMPELDVRVRPLREILIPLSRICVRRSNVSIDVNELRDSLMMISSKSKYKFGIDTGGALIARLRKRVDGGTWQSTMKPERVICSMFVSNVLRRATHHPFFRTLPIVLPGDFAIDEELHTVDLDWCCIEKPTKGITHLPDV